MIQQRISPLRPLLVDYDPVHSTAGDPEQVLLKDRVNAGAAHFPSVRAVLGALDLFTGRLAQLANDAGDAERQPVATKAVAVSALGHGQAVNGR